MGKGPYPIIVIVLCIVALFFCGRSLVEERPTPALTDPSFSAIIPLVLKNYTPPDRRFVAWHGPLSEVQAVGLAAYNTIVRWPHETIPNLHVPWGTSCRRVAMWAAVHPGRLYVMGDEPDIVGLTPGHYLAWYNPCYSLIKAADPHSRVAIAGIAQPCIIPGAHGLDYLGLMWALGFETDQLRVHAFAQVGNLSAWQAYIMQWIQWRDLNMPGTPIALGTFGYPDSPDQSEQVLADMGTALQWLRETELEQWCWWAWREKGTNYLYDRGALTRVGTVWVEYATIQ